MEQHAAYSKPLPVISRLNEPYWQATRRHELHMQKCRACGSWVYPISPICQECWSEDIEWAPLSGKGVISSWIVYHRAFDQRFAADVPYAVIQVELQEGPRLTSSPTGIPLDQLRAGLPVEATFEDVNQEVSLVSFRQVG